MTDENPQDDEEERSHREKVAKAVIEAAQDLFKSLRESVKKAVERLANVFREDLKPLMAWSAFRRRMRSCVACTSPRGGRIRPHHPCATHAEEWSLLKRGEYDSASEVW